MQTFLPYEDFKATAEVLDYRRLGKQRVETWQILQAMERTSGGWVNHPAVKMWRGYEDALALYGLEMCREWVKRGYKDTMTPRFEELIVDDVEYPEWLGDDRIHDSHKSNLLRKDHAYYAEYWPQMTDDIPYYWPV